VALLVVALTAGAVACGPEDDTAAPGASVGTTTVEAPTTTTTAAPTTTTTTAPPPPPEPPAPPPPTPDDIAFLQFHLGTMGYFLSDETGVYGSGTRNAVMAFQKLHGLQRDGIAGPQTLAALSTATPVEPRLGRHPHIEVDLAAQVAIVVDGGGGVTVVNATSGAAATPTPTGTWDVFRQVDGWDPGPYGALYRPKYFVGGVAFHGGVPILANPASHGCVRLPDPAVDWLWESGVAQIGTSVTVY
jgi:hypothetical protein